MALQQAARAAIAGQCLEFWEAGSRKNARRSGDPGVSGADDAFFVLLPGIDERLQAVGVDEWLVGEHDQHRIGGFGNGGDAGDNRAGHARSRIVIADEKSGQRCAGGMYCLPIFADNQQGIAAADTLGGANRVADQGLAPIVCQLFAAAESAAAAGSKHDGKQSTPVHGDLTGFNSGAEYRARTQAVQYRVPGATAEVFFPDPPDRPPAPQHSGKNNLSKNQTDRGARSPICIKTGKSCLP